MNPFEKFLESLAKVTKSPYLKPDSYGACLILMREEHVSLLFEWDDELVPNSVLLSSELIPFSPHYYRDICYACLRFNDSNVETLSVKPDEEMIFMHRRLHPDIQPEELKNVLENYVENFKIARETLRVVLENPPKIGQGPSSPSIQIFPFRV